MEKVEQLVTDKAFPQAIALLRRELADSRVAVFQSMLDCDFTNDTVALRSSIQEFIEHCRGTFKLGAIYLEMNEFDINPEQWRFDYFGYRRFGGIDDLDWLSDWDSDEDFSGTELHGLEAAQEAFREYEALAERGRDPQRSNAATLAAHLVTVRFIALIDRAVGSRGTPLPVPVLATAHGFDTVGCFEPPQRERGLR